MKGYATSAIAVIWIFGCGSIKLLFWGPVEKPVHICSRVWLNISLESFQVKGIARTTGTDQCAAKYQTVINISPCWQLVITQSKTDSSLWDILHIYLILDVVCGEKKKKTASFFSLCYNKLWQHSGEIPSLPSAVNVANVQTDGRKTVFEGKIFLFISTAQIQFYLPRDLPPAVAAGLAIKVKWRWKKQVKQIGLKKKRIYRV